MNRLFIMLSFTSFGVCFSESYNMYMSELHTASIVLMAFGFITLLIGNLLLTRETTNAFHDGYEQCDEDAGTFERMFREQKEKDE